MHAFGHCVGYKILALILVMATSYGTSTSNKICYTYLLLQIITPIRGIHCKLTVDQMVIELNSVIG